MAISKINITELIELHKTHLILDVRTPAEYEHAYIPSAINLPIFNNEQRIEIGTAYKQVSRQDAIKIGLHYFGPNLLNYINKVENLLKEHNKTSIILHCWRGGMRSGAMAWLLDFYGFNVSILINGYKAYRTWCLQKFEIPHPVSILGGYTGSGKSYVLQNLETKETTFIDLEKLASHKGSAFGAIKMPKQTSQEMFENNLALLLHNSNQGNTKVIFLEDESQRIGNLKLPDSFWLQMRKAKVYFLDIPFTERLQHIIEEYGNLPKQELIDASIRITRNLGGLEAKNVVSFLEENNTKDAFEILLKYYDKYYYKGLLKRDNLEKNLIKIACTEVNTTQNAQKVLHKI